MFIHLRTAPGSEQSEDLPTLEERIALAEAPGPEAASPSGPEAAHELTAARAAGRTFPRAWVGRRGLDEDAVARFRDDAVSALASAQAREERLREEIEALHRRLGEERAAVHQARADAQAAALGSGHDGARTPAEQAVELVQRAHRAADSRLAEAEQAAAVILHDARDQAAAVHLRAQDVERALARRAEEQLVAAEQRAWAVVDLARTRCEDALVLSHRRAQEVAAAMLATHEGDPRRSSGAHVYLGELAAATRQSLSSTLESVRTAFDELLAQALADLADGDLAVVDAVGAVDAPAGPGTGPLEVVVPDGADHGWADPVDAEHGRHTRTLSAVDLVPAPGDYSRPAAFSAR